MKEHSVVIGISSPSRVKAGEICCGRGNRIMSSGEDESVEHTLSRLKKSAADQKIDRNYKITPLEAMMFENGEPSSSSSLSREHEEQQGLLRRSMDLTLDQKEYLKPKAHLGDKLTKPDKLSQYQDDMLEMHESIQSMMSTTAMSKSSRNDSQDSLEDPFLEHSTCAVSLHNERNSQLRNNPSTSCFQSPSRSRHRFSSKNGDNRFPVPHDIFSPRGAPVSPLSLSLDPSPGHTQISMYHNVAANSRKKTAMPLSGRQLADHPPRLLSHVSENTIGTASSGSTFSSSLIPGTSIKGQTAMDSFESFDFLPEPLGAMQDDSDEDINYNDDHGDIFIVDTSSIAPASTRSTVSSSSGSVNLSICYSPVGRQDMASFSWKRNDASPVRSTDGRNKQRSVGNEVGRAFFRPRNEGLLAAPMKQRSADSIAPYATFTKAGHRDLEHINPGFGSVGLNRRPPTPIKRRSKMRSLKEFHQQQRNNAAISGSQKAKSGPNWNVPCQAASSDSSLSVSRSRGIDLKSVSSRDIHNGKQQILRPSAAPPTEQKEYQRPQRRRSKSQQFLCQPDEIESNGPLRRGLRRSRSTSRPRSNDRNSTNSPRSASKSK